MKRLLSAFLIVAASLFASAAYSQVRIHANINLPLPPLPPIPHARVYTQSAPEAAYQENCQRPLVQYSPEYSRERVVVTEPGYGYNYYNYGRDYRHERFHERNYRDRDDYRRHGNYREHNRYERGDRRW